MRPTKIILDNKTRQAVLKGVNSMYEPVRRTFGPEGKNALLYGTFGREPRITNDGFTVAEAQDIKDPFVRLVSEIFKDACKRTNEIVGDGTTTTTIIGGKLYNDIHGKLVDNKTTIGDKSNKIGQIALKKEILEAGEKVKKEVKKKAKKIKSLEELEKIAIVSVRDEELGKLVAKMAWDVGVDGFIDTVEGYKGEIETETIKGMRFPAKIAAKGFVNNPSRYEMVANDSAVLITNYKLDNVHQTADTLNKFIDKYPKVIIFAPEFSTDVLEDLYNATFQTKKINGQVVKQKGKYDIYPVKVPSLRTEQFEDLAIYCGATFINKDTGKELISVNNEDLGFVEKLVVKDMENKEDAVAIGGQGTKLTPLKSDDPGFADDVEVPTKTPLQERIEILKGQLKETKQENFKNLMKRRIASMASAVGVIRVGAPSRAETYYQKKKIEDAVYACKSALRGGYVKGGGLALKEIAENTKGIDILKDALIEPYNQIQSSVDGGVEITDDIIDSAESLEYAVHHACSVVSNLATVDIIIPQIDMSEPEEGSFAIAEVMKRDLARKKIKDGQLKANEEEAWLDNFGGMTENEFNESFEHND